MGARTLRLLAALVVALGFTAGASAQIAVARVNGVAIMSDALDRGFNEQLRARGLNISRMQNPGLARDLKRAALDVLIRNELLWQKARDEGKVASDQDVDRALAQTVGQFKSRAAFERSIARDGFDDGTFRDYVRRMLSADRAAQELVDARVAVTEADVKQYYETNRERFSRPETVRASLILVRVESSAGPEEHEQARAKAASIRTRILAGEDFADLARRYSEHPTKPWGGALDPVTRGQLAPPLDEAAFRLAPGEVSEVIETEAGLNVLRVEQRLPAFTQPLAQASESIRKYLHQLRGREVLEREVAALRERNKVEVLLQL